MEEYREVKAIYSSPHANMFVYGRTEGEIEELFQNRFKANLTPELSGVYVLERGKELVATVNLVRDEYQCNHVLHLGGLVVKKECLGQGLGKELLAKVEQLALSTGLKKLQLEVETDNPLAYSLYIKAGYVEEGRMEDFVQREVGYVDEIMMGKKI